MGTYRIVAGVELLPGGGSDRLVYNHLIHKIEVTCREEVGKWLIYYVGWSTNRWSEVIDFFQMTLYIAQVRIYSFALYKSESIFDSFICKEHVI